jgi:hypothetical protein
MLKPKSDKISGYTQIQQTSRTDLKERCLPARKLMDTCFLGQERSADGGIHATGGNGNVACALRTLNKLRRAGHSEDRACIADIRCGAPP